MIGAKKLRRRHVLLALGGGATSTLAGCNALDGDEPDSGDEEPNKDGGDDGGDETPTPDGEATPEDDDGGDETPTPDEEATPEDDDGGDETPTPDEEATPEDEDDGPGPDAVDIDVVDQIGADSFTVESVETAVAVTLELVDEEGRSLAPPVVLDANDTLDDYAVHYTEPLSRNVVVTARIVHDESGVLATASASVWPTIVELVRGDVTFINAAPDVGFHYPYYVYIPETADSAGPILVQPNNTGTSTDDFSSHRNRAEELASSDSFPRELSDELAVPLLVPVFPRPQNEPVSWEHYVHALDAETMAIDDGPLERVDLQLLAMIDHCRASLDFTVDYDADEQVLMNGFSASGNFVNRFTALHPNRVRSVSAGGLNGTLTLPLKSAKGRTLPYPIGVANLSALTGNEFDRAAWENVNQFLYLGSEDDNDTIPYNDAWNSQLREIALDVYGEDIHAERMPYCTSVYEESGANAQLTVYQNVAHQILRWVRRDIYEFHLRHMDRNGEFDPIRVRDASELEISFAVHPRDGDTSISLRILVPKYYKIGNAFSDGSIAPMLGPGDEIDWRDRIQITSGGRHMRADDLPVDETRTFDIERPLERGEQITIGLMDGAIIKSETVVVD